MCIICSPATCLAGLFLACRLVVLQSVCHNRVKFNMIDDQKETSLMLAVCMGQEKELLVQSLLEISSLESILQPSENPQRFGQDAFLMALVANNRNMAKLILERLLQLAKEGSLMFHDFGQMLCRVYSYIPALFLLIRMGTSSESMLDLILEISQICKVRQSSSVDDADDHTQSKLSGERGLMHILSSLTDGFGCSALHHVSQVTTVAFVWLLTRSRPYVPTALVVWNGC